MFNDQNESDGITLIIPDEKEIIKLNTKYGLDKEYIGDFLKQHKKTNDDSPPKKKLKIDWNKTCKL